jgi:hypothetical protein
LTTSVAKKILKDICADFVVAQVPQELRMQKLLLSDPEVGGECEKPFDEVKIQQRNADCVT